MENDREKKEVLLRLKRVEGQVRGIQRMIEQGVPCPEIMTQVAAATAAMKRVGMAIVRAYMEECLNRTKQEPAAKREETLKDFQRAISCYIDWA